MARSRNAPKIDSRTARLNGKPALKLRREPYWCGISKGLAVGYRKGATGGTWIAKHYSPETGRRIESLGVADDYEDADSIRVLSFDQAQAKAREWAADMSAYSAGVSRKVYTVGDACDAWLKTQTGTTAATHVEQHIRPELGHIVLSKLTKSKLYDWHQALAVKAPAWTRFEKCEKVFDITDPETRRKRQDTANRVLRSLRALLTLAYETEKVKSNAAWDTLKPFDKTDRMRTDYLTPDEAKRFIEVCDDDFRNMVLGALYTGCRYGELCTMRVDAYDSHIHAIKVLQGKTKRLKILYLSNDEVAFFDEQVKGKQSADFMFVRSDGTDWRKDHQRERMKDACAAAKVTKHITFHNLRHTFGSLLAMGGTRRELVQKQMGHSSARMTDRYTHFEQSWEQEIIRNNKPSFGYVAPGPVLVTKTA
jgi:integrase